MGTIAKLIILLAALAGSTPVSAQSPLCLNARKGEEASANCLPDPYSLATKPIVAVVARDLGVNLAQIRFSGCARGGFSIVELPGATARSQYLIRYPASGPYDQARLIGPLVHEMAHAMQLRLAGGMERLRANLEHSSDRIELGADFVAGIVFRRHVDVIDRAQFQNSLNLIGNYRNDAADSHNTPEARMAAFRTGFYWNRGSKDLGATHTLFQDDYFSEIVRNASRP